jgi:putative ABC transport system permease protein
MAGFDFDNSVIFPYYTAASLLDIRSLDHDPMLAVKAGNGKNLEDVKYEVEGVLRRVRKVKPGQGNDFAINHLSQVSERIESIFGSIDVGAWFIGGFSLLVGAFGIANIMFVTVKERTKIIGLKKAIGARKSSILLEFLLEAIVLCLIGGAMGIFIVLLLSLILTYGIDFHVTLSFYNFFVGISISLVVGVISGIIPAWFASRLDTVVAIRTN